MADLTKIPTVVGAGVPSASMTSTPAAVLLPPSPHGPLVSGGGEGGAGSSSWSGTVATTPAPVPAATPASTPPSTTVATSATGATAPVASAAQSVPTGARLLGPTEFASIALQNKVGAANESQFFFREKGTDKIYLKADAPLGGTSITTPPKDTNISVAGTGSPLPVAGSGGSATAAVGAAAGNSKLNDLAVQSAQLQQQQKDNTAASNKRFDDLITSATNGINEMTSVSYSKVLSDLQQQEDLKGKEAALDAIKGQIGDINTGLQQALLHAADQPIPLSFIRGQQAKIQQQAAAVVTALAAKADIIQGQLDRANTRITQFYNAKKEDISTQNDRVKMLLDLSEKKIVHLDDNEKEALKFQVDNYNSLKDSIDKEHQQIIQLATQYPDAFAKADVNFNMPVDEILQKVGAAKGEITQVKDNQSLVVDLIKKYPDAGILPTDDVMSAESKLGNSKIYFDQIRGPVSSGGGGGTSSAGSLNLSDIQTTLNNYALIAGAGNLASVPAWAQDYLVADSQYVPDPNNPNGPKNKVLKYVAKKIISTDVANINKLIGTQTVEGTGSTGGATVDEVVANIKEAQGGGVGYSSIRDNLMSQGVDEETYRAALRRVLNEGEIKPSILASKVYGF